MKAKIIPFGNVDEPAREFNTVKEAFEACDGRYEYLEFTADTGEKITIVNDWEGMILHKIEETSIRTDWEGQRHIEEKK
jgi:hypothetical protein